MIREKLSNLKYYGYPLVKCRWVNGYADMGSTITYPYLLYSIGHGYLLPRQDALLGVSVTDGGVFNTMSLAQQT
jgi:hypothetical protein